MALLRAWRYVASVPAIDLEELAGMGVRAVLLDRDNTCVPRDATSAPRAVSDWLDRARSLGMSLCLVSNNFHSTHVAASARELGVEKVDHAMKPAPFAVWAALRKLGVPREAAVLVGDQVFTDVMAGNLAGVRTILVRPQSRTDLFYTQAFRVVENLVLSGVTYEGEGALSPSEGPAAPPDDAAADGPATPDGEAPGA